jgi:hypothetical protein
MTDYAELLGSHQFALVDRANLPPLDWHKDLPLLPLVPTMLKASPEKLPALLPLKDDAPYMKALVENMEEAEENPDYRTLCALLSTQWETEPKKLQKHLTNRLVAFLVGGGRGYLRYFDPLVFPKLLNIIAPQRIAQLYGPIEQWTIPFQQEWLPFPKPEAESTAIAWMLAHSEWARVERILRVNAALMGRELTVERLWESFEEYNKAGVLAERAMTTAQNLYGFSDPDDLTAYMVDALLHGEHFHRHPSMNKLLRNLPPDGYAAASGRLSETTWAEIETFAHNHS